VAQKSRVERYFPCRNLAAAPLNILFCAGRLRRRRGLGNGNGYCA
jgi:hypothetical protein